MAGGDSPLDEAHLDRLDTLLRRYKPESFSEHLAWSSHGGTFYNDLLPAPYNAASLALVCEHIDRVQTRLGRQEPARSILQFVQQFRVPVKKPK
jgi:uncharacterized protein (UPF0276 family)